MRSNNSALKKAQSSTIWYVIGIILALLLLVFLVYLAVKSGGFAETLSKKIL